MSRKYGFHLLFLFASIGIWARSAPGAVESRLTRGVTVYFFARPDEGIFITFQGKTAKFRYLDGMKADGSLQSQADQGTFTVSGEKVTVRGAFLEFKPVEYANWPMLAKEEGPGFQLASPDLPFGGMGPVLLPAERTRR